VVCHGFSAIAVKCRLASAPAWGAADGLGIHVTWQPDPVPPPDAALHD
jgi:hypothetical protein